MSNYDNRLYLANQALTDCRFRNHTLFHQCKQDSETIASLTKQVEELKQRIETLQEKLCDY